VIAHHVRDGGNQRVGIAGLQSCEYGQEREVRDNPGKDLDVLHLAGHDRLRSSGRLQDLDAAPQLPQRNPVEIGVGVARRLLEIRECFLFDGDHGDVVAEGACTLQGEKREPAIAGDEAYPGHYWSGALPRRPLSSRRGRAQLGAYRPSVARQRDSGGGRACGRAMDFVTPGVDGPFESPAADSGAASDYDEVRSVYQKATAARPGAGG
jgi:hypothetical protein